LHIRSSRIPHRDDARANVAGFTPHLPFARRLVMYAMRRWSVRKARALDRLYGAFEKVLIAGDPLFAWLGYERLERPVASVEQFLKGFFFDCRMCGQCVLSKTGMSCPMNCPKTIRNGPCGGVRADGNCEVVPTMRCVWIEAHEGNRRIGRPERLSLANAALDNRLWGRSSWLRVARDHAVRSPA
jgi:hypothetical protein